MNSRILRTSSTSSPIRSLQTYCILDQSNQKMPAVSENKTARLISNTLTLKQYTQNGMHGALQSTCSYVAGDGAERAC